MSGTQVGDTAQGGDPGGPNYVPPTSARPEIYQLRLGGIGENGGGKMARKRGGKAKKGGREKKERATKGKKLAST